MRHTLINKQGGRTVHFSTPCGYMILIDQQPRESPLIVADFEGKPMSFVNSQLRLSADGLKILGKEIERLYADTDDDFRLNRR